MIYLPECRQNAQVRFNLQSSKWSHQITETILNKLYLICEKSFETNPRNLNRIFPTFYSAKCCYHVETIYDNSCTYIIMVKWCLLKMLQLVIKPGGHFNIKMPCYHNRDCYYKDEMVSNPSYFMIESPILGKMVFILEQGTEALET